ncbi:MAG: hypothetical protein FWF46_09435, partial [Oscillospiraceae bacterium]|nr:hypothetical protein [Oscillospiraceae bacterium]
LNYAVNYLVSGIGGAVGQDLSSMVSSAQNIYNFVQNLNKYTRASYANMMMGGLSTSDTSSEDYNKTYDYYYNQGYNLYTGLLGIEVPELDSSTSISSAEKITLVESTLKESSVLDNANYAQSFYSNSFSVDGSNIYSELVGENIKTIDDLVNAIKSGKVNVSDIPVEYIVRDGNTLILNTRTSQALTQAGIPRSQWNAVNMTGNAEAEIRLTNQLNGSKLTSTGTSTVVPNGGGGVR